MSSALQQRIDRINSRTEKRLKIMREKGTLYCGGRDDPDRSFNEVLSDVPTRCAGCGGAVFLTGPQVVMIYLAKHLAALRSVISLKVSHDPESIEERIMDCQNYLDILADMLAPKRL